MKFQDRAIRIAAALTLAGLIASQIPMRADTALGSVQQPKDGYLNAGGDNSGSFLGISGLSNRNAITGLGFTLVGLGVYSTLLDSRSIATTGANAIGGAAGAGTNGITTGDSDRSIYNITRDSSSDFSELVKLIDDAGLTNTLRTQGPFTFFAPTNMALMVSDTPKLRQPENKALLVHLLEYHIVKGRYTIGDLLTLKNGTKLKTLSGESVVIRNQNGVLTINNVTIIQNDMAASNGWIHAITALLEQF